MVTVRGRRLNGRTRRRTGCLSNDASGETAAADVDPADPGATDPGDTGETISVGIDLGIVF
jgi:hypothetical protein